jgi:hypothetical protein
MIDITKQKTAVATANWMRLFNFSDFGILNPSLKFPIPNRIYRIPRQNSSWDDSRRMSLEEER